jgi:6-pyruvoyltetrahydropterin/6-carboxytetrahydropterin synthase
MFMVTRTHEICAGHRVFGHEGKCKHLHGHAYRFELTCSAPQLDSLGRIMDFSVIKTRLCDWLETTLDHKMMLWQQDPIGPALAAMDQAVVLLPDNPTAENLAKHMVETVGPLQLKGTGVTLVRCEVWETSKCSATYILPPVRPAAPEASKEEVQPSERPGAIAEALA